MVRHQQFSSMCWSDVGTVANNGLEALNLIREADRQAKRGGQRKKKPYSVILMDLEMPGGSSDKMTLPCLLPVLPCLINMLTLPAVMDGLTALREIRTAEAAGTLERNVVMALTGNARQGQIDHALAAGMDDGECHMGSDWAVFDIPTPLLPIHSDSPIPRAPLATPTSTGIRHPSFGALGYIHTPLNLNTNAFRTCMVPHVPLGPNPIKPDFALLAYPRQQSSSNPMSSTTCCARSRACGAKKPMRRPIRPLPPPISPRLLR